MTFGEACCAGSEMSRTKPLLWVFLFWGFFIIPPVTFGLGLLALYWLPEASTGYAVGQWLTVAGFLLTALMLLLLVRWSTSPTPEQLRERQEAERLDAERLARQREQRIVLFKKYWDVAPISIGTGILAGILVAIESHRTTTAWNYEVSLEQAGWPPLWLWAAIGAVAIVSGLIRSRK